MKVNKSKTLLAETLQIKAKADSCWTTDEGGFEMFFDWQQNSIFQYLMLWFGKSFSSYSELCPEDASSLPGTKCCSDGAPGKSIAIRYFCLTGSDLAGSTVYTSANLPLLYFC